MASNEFQPLQGMSDIQSPEIYLWRMIEERARSLFAAYGYEELRTPSLEKLSVFKRSIGDTTDIVQKEMYAFEDRGGRNLALRPEGTAGTIRHLAGRGEEGLNARVFYISPMFRCERPQAGRKRQFPLELPKINPTKIVGCLYPTLSRRSACCRPARRKTGA